MKNKDNIWLWVAMIGLIFLCILAAVYSTVWSCQMWEKELGNMMPEPTVITNQNT